MLQRSKRPLSIWGITALALLALALTSGSGGLSAHVPSSDASATATRDAELTEIAALRTEVASLRTAGADRTVDDPLGGRLGGTRASFRQAFGDPEESSSPREDRFIVSGIGDVRVTSVGDRAIEVAIAPLADESAIGTAGSPTWTEGQTDDIINRFAPADATIISVQPEPKMVEQTRSGDSEALAAIAPTLTTCGGSGDSDFDVTVTFADSPNAATIVLAIAGDTVATSDDVAPVPTGGGGTVATVSLGGSTTVNGVRVAAAGVQRDAAGALPTQDGQQLVAVEIELQNQTSSDLIYSADDFRLSLDDEHELTAACGGVEPAIVDGKLAPNGSVRGWVSFAIPEDAVPLRFTYLVGGSPTVRAGFKLP